MLRAPAHLTGFRAGSCRGASQHRQAHPLAESGTRFVFELLPVGHAGGRSVTVAGDAQRQAAAVAAQSVLFAELNSISTESAVRHLRSPAGNRPPRPLPSEGDGCCRRRKRCCRGFSGRRRRSRRRLCGMAGCWIRRRALRRVARDRRRRLLPAARRLERDDVLVASGVSCRHQIADFTSARAMHPAELLGTLVQETA
jgi:hypothetical protein